MSERRRNVVLGEEGASVRPWREEIVEAPVLLSGRQAEALEHAACLQGKTVGELIRGLVAAFLEERKTSDPEA